MQNLLSAQFWVVFELPVLVSKSELFLGANCPNCTEGLLAGQKCQVQLLAHVFPCSVWK